MQCRWDNTDDEHEDSPEKAASPAAIREIEMCLGSEELCSESDKAITDVGLLRIDDSATKDRSPHGRLHR